MNWRKRNFGTFEKIFFVVLYCGWGFRPEMGPFMFFVFCFLFSTFRSLPLILQRHRFLDMALLVVLVS